MCGGFPGQEREKLRLFERRHDKIKSEIGRIRDKLGQVIEDFGGGNRWLNLSKDTGFNVSVDGYLLDYMAYVLRTLNKAKGTVSSIENSMEAQHIPGPDDMKAVDKAELHKLVEAEGLLSHFKIKIIEELEKVCEVPVTVEEPDQDNILSVKVNQCKSFLGGLCGNRSRSYSYDDVKLKIEELKEEIRYPKHRNLRGPSSFLQNNPCIKLASSTAFEQPNRREFNIE